jgi:hypothetical protein
MHEHEPDQIGRRDLLKGALAASTAMFVAGDRASAAAPGPNAPDPKLIERENARPGAIDWQLTYVRLDKPDGYRSPGIEGYCPRQSVSAGETIDFMVSTDPPAQFVIEVFRMGYYGGRGARRMAELGPFAP